MFINPHLHPHHMHDPYGANTTANAATTASSSINHHYPYLAHHQTPLIYQQSHLMGIGNDKINEGESILISKHQQQQQQQHQHQQQPYNMMQPMVHDPYSMVSPSLLVNHNNNSTKLSLATEESDVLIRQKQATAISTAKDHSDLETAAKDAGINSIGNIQPTLAPQILQNTINNRKRIEEQNDDDDERNESTHPKKKQNIQLSNPKQSSFYTQDSISNSNSNSHMYHRIMENSSPSATISATATSTLHSKLPHIVDETSLSNAHQIHHHQQQHLLQDTTQNIPGHHHHPIPDHLRSFPSHIHPSQYHHPMYHHLQHPIPSATHQNPILSGHYPIPYPGMMPPYHHPGLHHLPPTHHHFSDAISLAYNGREYGNGYFMRDQAGYPINERHIAPSRSSTSPDHTSHPQREYSPSLQRNINENKTNSVLTTAHGNLINGNESNPQGNHDIHGAHRLLEHVKQSPIDTNSNGNKYLPVINQTNKISQQQQQLIDKASKIHLTNAISSTSSISTTTSSSSSSSSISATAPIVSSNDMPTSKIEVSSIESTSPTSSMGCAQPVVTSTTQIKNSKSSSSSSSSTTKLESPVTNNDVDPLQDSSNGDAASNAAQSMQGSPHERSIVPPIIPAPKPRLKAKPPNKWTPEEDKALMEAVAKYGAKNWRMIAEHVPGRTHTQCLQRYNKGLRPDLVHGSFSREEDEIILNFVGRDVAAGRPINWKYIKDKGLPNRTTRQIRERYQSCLSADVKKGGFTTEEDLLILSMQMEFGNRWAHIARQLEGRTEHAVKTRYKSLANRIERLFSPNADEMLLELHKNTNEDWDAIAQAFAGYHKIHLMARYRQLVGKSNDSTE